MTFVIGCYCHFIVNIFLIGYYYALFGVFFFQSLLHFFFAVIMQHINKKTSDLKKLQMIILIAPNYIGRDNTPVTIPRLAVG
jgi:hypothetical protein